MLRLFRKLFLLAALFFIGLNVAHSEDGNSIIYGAKDGVAIEGYDVVAYFKDKAPIKGKPEFKTNYAGTDWQFNNQENLDLFIENPDHYIPQYGGYCAFASANNAIASGDPNRWRIVDDKLYLNTNFLAKKFWEANIPENIRAADKNWTGLAAKIEGKNTDTKVQLEN